jgi:Got1/Sft2-like family
MAKQRRSAEKKLEKRFARRNASGPNRNFGCQVATTHCRLAASPRASHSHHSMSAANESTFRNSLNNLGWSRRQPASDSDLSTAAPSFLQRINPFAGAGRGYIRLPTSQQDLPAQLPAATPAQENAAWFALSQWDRLIVFGCCVLGAAACFVMAFFLLPVLVLKPRKFVVLWTVGSILFLCRYAPRKMDVDGGSFAALQGPVPYIKHLVSPTRLPFTAAYFGSLGLTLYFAVGVRHLSLVSY